MVTAVREAAIGDGDDEVVGGTTLVLARLTLTGATSRSRRSMAGRRRRRCMHTTQPAICPGVSDSLRRSRLSSETRTRARDAITELGAMDWAVHVADYEVTIGSGLGRGRNRRGHDAGAQPDRRGGRGRRPRGNRFTHGLLLHEALRIGAQTP